MTKTDKMVTLQGEHVFMLNSTEHEILTAHEA